MRYFKIQNELQSFCSYHIMAHSTAATTSLMMHSPSSITPDPFLQIFSQQQYKDTTA
jgi:hypothetical protein